MHQEGKFQRLKKHLPEDLWLEICTLCEQLARCSRQWKEDSRYFLETCHALEAGYAAEEARIQTVERELAQLEQECKRVAARLATRQAELEEVKRERQAVMDEMSNLKDELFKEAAQLEAAARSEQQGVIEKVETLKSRLDLEQDVCKWAEEEVEEKKRKNSFYFVFLVEGVLQLVQLGHAFQHLIVFHGMLLKVHLFEAFHFEFNDSIHRIQQIQDVCVSRVSHRTLWQGLVNCIDGGLELGSGKLKARDGLFNFALHCLDALGGGRTSRPGYGAQGQVVIDASQCVLEDEFFFRVQPTKAGNGRFGSKTSQR